MYYIISQLADVIQNILPYLEYPREGLSCHARLNRSPSGAPHKCFSMSHLAFVQLISALLFSIIFHPKVLSSSWYWILRIFFHQISLNSYICSHVCSKSNQSISVAFSEWPLKQWWDTVPASVTVNCCMWPGFEPRSTAGTSTLTTTMWVTKERDSLLLFRVFSEWAHYYNILSRIQVCLDFLWASSIWSIWAAQLLVIFTQIRQTPFSVTDLCLLNSIMFGKSFTQKDHVETFEVLQWCYYFVHFCPCLH